MSHLVTQPLPHLPDPAALVGALLQLAAATPAQVLQWLAQQGWTAAALDRMAPPLGTATTPYVRQVLALTSQAEVMVARWRPGVPCAPHDHGAAGGWVVFASGTFVETTWMARGRGYEATAARTHRAPAASRVAAGAFHHCLCAEEGLSLHVYTPPIEGMQVLDLDHRRTLRLASHCGAWLPQRPADVLATTGW